jgi:hypothetical protein
MGAQQQQAQNSYTTKASHKAEQGSFWNCDMLIIPVAVLCVGKTSSHSGALRALPVPHLVDLVDGVAVCVLELSGRHLGQLGLPLNNQGSPPGPVILDVLLRGVRGGGGGGRGGSGAAGRMLVETNRQMYLQPSQLRMDA